jgi:hypothetical protein
METKGDNYELFSWSGRRGSEQRSIRISQFSSDNPDSEKAFRNYPAMVNRVRTAWNLQNSPKLFCAEDWGNYFDWRSLVGSRISGFKPTTIINLGINEQTFFLECFQLGSTPVKAEKRATQIGGWLSFVFEKLPPVGEEYGGVVIRDPFGEDSQIFWLGVVLQGRRAIARR